MTKETQRFIKCFKRLEMGNSSIRRMFQMPTIILN